MTTLLGYFVRKSIVLCLRDLPRFEEVLTELLKAGANSVPGIELKSTELRKHRDKARAAYQSVMNEAGGGGSETDPVAGGFAPG